MNYISEKKFFSDSTLKIIAVIAMIIDHIGKFLLVRNDHMTLFRVMNGIGRIAFPIFCFLLVEGYFHTKNVKKYMLRLFAFAIISEIPFDMAASGRFILGFHHQNVLFTLFIGLVVIFFIDKFQRNVILQAVIVLIGCVVAFLIKSDYLYFGIIQIVMIYYFRNELLMKNISIALINVYMAQPAAIASVLLTSFYNGKRGLKFKYFFYILYPAHLIVIYFIRVYLL